MERLSEVVKGDAVAEEEELHPTLVRYYDSIFSLTPFVSNSPIDGEMSNAYYAYQLTKDVKSSEIRSEEHNDVNKEIEEYYNDNGEERNEVDKENETNKSNFDDSNKGEDIKSMINRSKFTQENLIALDASLFDDSEKVRDTPFMNT